MRSLTVPSTSARFTKYPEANSWLLGRAKHTISTILSAVFSIRSVTSSVWSSRLSTILYKSSAVKYVLFFRISSSSKSNMYTVLVLVTQGITALRRVSRRSSFATGPMLACSSSILSDPYSMTLRSRTRPSGGGRFSSRRATNLMNLEIGDDFLSSIFISLGRSRTMAQKHSHSRPSSSSEFSSIGLYASLSMMRASNSAISRRLDSAMLQMIRDTLVWSSYAMKAPDTLFEDGYGSSESDNCLSRRMSFFSAKLLMNSTFVRIVVSPDVPVSEKCGFFPSSSSSSNE
mmetsp:Transcript_3383/g.8768  ORF Transcript_3383/g.8768 Transcript_3383/m.8768 type:complete len:288 (-) Transcript_3383:847-1710(-)